jgi:putative dehydrogenase
VKKVGFIGLGNMGMGMAKNLLSKGFMLKGYDLRQETRDEIKNYGGIPVDTPAAATVESDVVFIMVLNGQQVINVIEDGFTEKLKKGATVIICPTIGRSFAKQAEKLLAVAGAKVIDAPVSGGKSGADSGTLTMMVAAEKAVYEANYEFLKAVGKQIYYVGEAVGQGQVVKSCLQGMIGASYEALFEALVLGAKAGVDIEALSGVLNDSFLGSNLTKFTSEQVMDRRFQNTGARIGVTHKDLGITMSLAKELGVPMFVTSIALEMFQAGLSSFPDGDNSALIQVLERIAGIEVKRKAKNE